MEVNLLFYNSFILEGQEITSILKSPKPSDNLKMTFLTVSPIFANCETRKSIDAREWKRYLTTSPLFCFLFRYYVIDGFGTFLS